MSQEKTRKEKADSFQQNEEQKIQLRQQKGKNKEKRQRGRRRKERQRKEMWRKMQRAKIKCISKKEISAEDHPIIKAARERLGK